MPPVDKHTVLDHLSNPGVVVLAVLLFTSVHDLFLKHLYRGARLVDKFLQIRLVCVFIFSLVAHSIEIKLLAMAQKASIASHLFFTYAEYHRRPWRHRASRSSATAGGRGSFDGLCADHPDGVLFVFGDDPDVGNSALRVWPALINANRGTTPSCVSTLS